MNKEYKMNSEKWSMMNLMRPTLQAYASEGNSDCQLIRSASKWSFGLAETESSI